MDELSNSVKNRNNINNYQQNERKRKIGNVKQPPSNANNNLMTLKNNVDQGVFSTRNKVVAPRSENNFRYKTI